MHVLIPNMEYKPHQPTKEVRRKIAPNAKSTYPRVPLTVSVKNNTANTIARTILTNLSTELIFFFITNLLNYFMIKTKAQAIRMHKMQTNKNLSFALKFTIKFEKKIDYIK